MGLGCPSFSAGQIYKGKGTPSVASTSEPKSRPFIEYQRSRSNEAAKRRQENWREISMGHQVGPILWRHVPCAEVESQRSFEGYKYLSTSFLNFILFSLSF